jgi:EAL domain-containing protein (putative c-di-GMP-specific phosphodiesterase class I)
VSPLQFQDLNFVDMVRTVLQETDIDSKWLEIEVTESALVKREIETLEKLEQLKALGIKISIDDFGVGYSSLERLKRMPVDVLKIDRTFIRDMHLDEAAITKAIIALAHNLHLEVVAEGVETEEQLTILQQYGCDAIQGFIFTPPIPVTEFEQFLDGEMIH